MMERMREVLMYLKGLALVYVATMFFAGVGWIEVPRRVAALGGFTRFVIPLLIALVVWTAIYFAHVLLWTALVVLSSCTFGIGFLFGLGFLGYASLMLARYLLPEGWVVFGPDDFRYLVMGGFYALVDLFVHPEILASATEPDKKDNQE
jgi:hypothetical protein